MAVYKLSLSAEAKLAEIYEYSLLTFGERQADKYYQALHDTFDLLVQAPGMGRTFRDFRRHDHGAHAIFYEPMDGGIFISQIYHHSEDIERRLQPPSRTPPE